MAGTLYIVATPIGNLEDITDRARRILGEVDFVLAEDTRVTKKLFDHFGIKTPLQSFHEYSQTGKVAQVISQLKEGKNIALVSDAGTPAISDPGAHLVSEAVRAVPDLKVVGLPGASSVVTALSVSGFPGDRFSFMGFLPPKKGRAAELKEMMARKETVVFFESPHRIQKTLEELAMISPERSVAVIRELTKMFETIHRGTLKDLAAPGLVRDQGEFVVVLGPTK